jgi:hypothetical protein
MVPGDQYHWCIRQSFSQPLELPKGKNDGVVSWTHRVKEITGNHDGIGVIGDHPVDGVTECLGHIGFALVDAA